MALLISEVVDAYLAETSGGRPTPSRNVPVMGLALDDYYEAVAVGDTISYSLLFLPANASNKSYTIEEDSEGVVVTINPDGTIVGKAVGQTRITFTSQDGGYVAVMLIDVKGDLIYLTDVSINEAPADMHVSDQKQLTTTLTPANADKTDLHWESSDVSVATVSPEGLVIGRGLGVYTITVTAPTDPDGDVTVQDTWTSNIVEPPAKVTGVDLTIDKSTILSNQTAKVTVVIQPANAANKNYNLTATPTGKVTINKATGVVTPAIDFDGKVTILVTTVDGSFTDSVELTVQQYIAVTAVKFNEAGKKVDVPVTTDYKTLAEIVPSGASVQGMTFSSSNTDVADVDEFGVVTGNLKGTANITVKSVDKPALSDVLAVTVVKNPTMISDYRPSSNILTVSGADNEYTVDGMNDDGTVYTINLSVVPSTGEWGSPTAIVQSGADVITTPVMDEGAQSFTLTGLKPGTGVVRLHSGIVGIDEVITHITFNVIHGVVAVTGVEISEGDSINVNLSAGTKQLTAVVKPAGATDKSVAWSTSDATVATVSTTGLVTVVKGGSATITVKTNDGNFTDNILVNVVDDVNKPLTGLTLTESPSASINWDGSNTFQMHLAYVPADTTETGVTWSSSAPSVMTVSATGLVTVLKLGNAIITATSTVHNTIKAQATMTVVDKRTVSITTPTISSSRFFAGGSYQLALIKSPVDGTVTGAWDTTDHTVATIDTNGLLKCLKAGSFGISYAGTDGSGAAVSDSSGGGTVTAADSISISTPSMRDLPQGATVTVPYTLTPADATTDPNVKVVPTTTDASIMSVNTANGTATGVLKSSTQVRMGAKVVVGTTEGDSDSSGMYVSDPLVGVTGAASATPSGWTYVAGTAVDGKNQATLTFASLAASKAAGAKLNVVANPSTSSIFNYTVNSANSAKCTAADSSASANTNPPTMTIKPVVVDATGTIVTVTAHGKILEIKVITSAA